MNNGNGAQFTDLSKESAVIGTIGTGLFDRVSEKFLIPTKAFVDERWAIVYAAARSLRIVGKPVCRESITNLIAAHRLDCRLQKAIDPKNILPWRDWLDFSDQETLALSTPRMVEYSLEVLGELYEKRQSAAIAKKMEAGELTTEEAIEELRAIGAENRTLPAMVSARQLCEKPPPRPPEIIEGILHQGSKMALGGGSKSFKTWMLLELAICVSSGQEWLGFATTAGKVLYLNFEIPEFSIQERVSAICEAMGIDAPANLILWNLRGYAADAGVILPIISRDASKKDFRLIVLDPLYKLLGSRDENAAHDMADLMNQVERLTVDTKASVVSGSHFAKGNASGKESMDRISGSGVFARDPDSIVTMTAHKQAGAFAVEMTLRNFPPQEAFVVRREHPLMVVDGKLDPAELKKAGGKEAIYDAEDLLELLDGGMKSTEWQETCKEDRGISERTFYRLLKELVDEGRVFKSEVDKKWTRKA